MESTVSESILVLDFGGQYNQLIARRVRELHVYSEVLPYDTTLSRIREGGYRGIIFTGGPSSVNAADAPRCDVGIYQLGIPILGICYGAQLIASQIGGRVFSPDKREYGNTEVDLEQSSHLFAGVSSRSICWMSHTDQIDLLPEGFAVTASTATCPVAAMENPAAGIYAVQFHPEVSHTREGQAMLANFVHGICGCRGDWIMKAFVAESVQALRERIGSQSVLCGLSGGVDSAVTAVMVHKAIGDQLTCIFVDHGLMRKDEGDMVEKVFSDTFNIRLIRVNAQERFLARLAGISDPERKRKIIGEEFIRVFEEEARKIGKIDLLAQGTIYPDVIESGGGKAATIKSHHNVGGMPADILFTGIVEPLRNLFKDEVRQAGLELGIPRPMVYRQPFPGPGLAVRILGDITFEKLELLREADAIFTGELERAGLDATISQYFAVLTGLQSVGVMGDARTYDYTIALRAVTTSDFMTAEWAPIPHEVLARVSNRIVNETPRVNRVVYDITTKPPATIEWE
ncbi:MAG TPA: glutamine-hydrolyzing GMP synthase [Clostridia bacterium]